MSKEVNGTTITHFNGIEIDLSKWRRFSMREAIIEFWPKNLPGKPELKDFDTDVSFRTWLHRFAQETQDLVVPSTGTDEELEGPRQLLAMKIRLLLPGAGDQPWSRGRHIAHIFESVAEIHLIPPT